MRHVASARFWHLYRALPGTVRNLAERSFATLKADPRHPSLRLKRVGILWSVRIGSRYRALGLDAPDGILWVWVGSHDDYERLIRTRLGEEVPPAYWQAPTAAKHTYGQ